MSTASPRPTLTIRQAAIYDFIRARLASGAGSPSVREIGDAQGIASPNGVICHLKALEKKGYIERGGSQARSIRLVGMRPCPNCEGLGLVERPS